MDVRFKLQEIQDIETNTQNAPTPAHLYSNASDTIQEALQIFSQNDLDHPRGHAYRTTGTIEFWENHEVFMFLGGRGSIVRFLRKQENQLKVFRSPGQGLRLGLIMHYQKREGFHKSKTMLAVCSRYSSYSGRVVPLSAFVNAPLNERELTFLQLANIAEYSFEQTRQQKNIKTRQQLNQIVPGLTFG
jgi:hypothetical protein